MPDVRPRSKIPDRFPLRLPAWPFTQTRVRLRSRVSSSPGARIESLVMLSQPGSLPTAPQTSKSRRKFQIENDQSRSSKATRRVASTASWVLGSNAEPVAMSGGNAKCHRCFAVQRPTQRGAYVCGTILCATMDDQRCEFSLRYTNLFLLDAATNGHTGSGRPAAALRPADPERAIDPE